MTEELKTLKDFDFDELGYFINDGITDRDRLRKKAIRWIRNLQYKDTKYPIILEQFPEDMKGSIARDNWNKSIFRIGCEYGMLAWIMYFFNITEDDLK